MRRLRYLFILLALSILPAFTGNASMNCTPGLLCPVPWNPWNCAPWTQDGSNCQTCEVTAETP